MYWQSKWHAARLVAEAKPRAREEFGGAMEKDFHRLRQSVKSKAYYINGAAALSTATESKSSYYHKWISQRDKNKNNKKEASVEKEKNGHLNHAFHLKVVGPINKAGSHKALPHTSKEVLPLRPGLVPNGTQPVNIVRPLRPTQSPRGGPRDLKVVRPPLPAGKPPTVPPKSPPTPQRLSPPKKPLPLNPTRSPLLVSDRQSRTSPFPPQRPLPLSPARAASTSVSPTHSTGSKTTGLLVMMPPAPGPQPVGKVSAIPPLRVLRPIPGARPKTASHPPPRK
ncbi:proline-rich receptor-like protein kinase PERK2 [Fundulus heteroclitus]|uniref:proline-rich receptor-like protein kinase PERK2 n=1 Tax=Fundulus heteroclitus TaxID=8078 RepID=UPI00165C1B8A|nr:proline-rich receptor-like protein kinase PERK2 [Fundulus heteroclitus]